MIDLGDELAGYGEQPSSAPTNPEGMDSFGRLADLQAGGFNIDPRRSDGGFVQDSFDRPAQGSAALGDPRWSFAGPGKFTISAMPLVANQLTRIVGGLAGTSTTGIHIYNPGFEPTGSISEDVPTPPFDNLLPGDPE